VFFAITTILAALPFWHFIIASGIYKAHDLGMFWSVLTIVLCALATCLYGSKTPERYWPGKFDLWVSTRLRVTLTGRPRILCVLFVYRVAAIRSCTF
jgi:adiponectin receptor